VKRGILAVLILGVVAAAYGYSVTRRETRHRELVQLGDAAMSGGDLSAAIEAFSGAIFLREDSMIGYLKRGDAYRRRGDLESALRDLRRAADIDPAAPRPRELLGDVNYTRNRFGPAVEHYQAYVDLDDRSPRVLYKLGLARYRAGQPGLGIQALDRAVALDDRLAEAYYLRGLCERDAQMPAAAAASLKRAIAVAPTMFQAREELADLYERLGRLQDWVEQLEALSALDPGPARDVALGLAYVRAGQPDRAVLTLRHAAGRHPDYRYTFVALGRIWLEAAQARSDQVELSKAIEALELAIDRDGSSEAYTLYGRALLLASDKAYAETVLRQAAGKRPADPLAFYYLAEAAERLGRIEPARDALLDYVAIAGDEQDDRRRAALSARIGGLSMRLSDFPLALEHFGRAAPQLSSNPDFMVAFAEARWRGGDGDAARAMLDRILEKDPAHAAARALRLRMR
jgi:tetratricopeptide (TPR) repeat protein